MKRRTINSLTSEQLEDIIQKIEPIDKENITTKELIKAGLFNSSGQAGSIRDKGHPPEFVQKIKFGTTLYPKIPLMQWLNAERNIRKRREGFEKKMKKCALPVPPPQARPSQLSLYEMDKRLDKHRKESLFYEGEEETFAIRVSLPRWVMRVMESEIGKDLGDFEKLNWIKKKVVETFFKRVDLFLQEEELKKAYIESDKWTHKELSRPNP